ncbi:hypothetical protein QYS48_17940 [Marivirga arenosa]|uniref:Uncharacterized protein n=1 Tax=Marivirga arenosa TaxID=3059076 RepID=A0AA49GHG7_9BACT|nr:hypothetical protein [Marivirga sp. ABR2-2]WKK84089.1 hypothetical protein QYS48_17940 [Marivirga sp. ABR2-2]
MTKNPHLKLNIKKQADPVTEHKFNYGGGSVEADDDKDYKPMADAFRRSLKGYKRAREERELIKMDIN